MTPKKTSFLADLDGSQQPLDPGSVDLQALLENGTINPETFSALTGQSVNIIQESDLPHEEQQLEQDENNVGVVRIVQATSESSAVVGHAEEENQEQQQTMTVVSEAEDIKVSDLLGTAFRLEK